MDMHIIMPFLTLPHPFSQKTTEMNTDNVAIRILLRWWRTNKETPVPSIMITIDIMIFNFSIGDLLQREKYCFY